jgi:hypothetical protein
MNIFATKSFWYWTTLPFKAYIIAVPIFVLICPFLEKHILVSKSGALSYWQMRFQNKIVDDEWVRMFRLIEWGYVGCLTVLIFAAIYAKLKKNKPEFRGALFFAILALILLVFFYPGTLTIKTK